MKTARKKIKYGKRENKKMGRFIKNAGDR